MSAQDKHTLIKLSDSDATVADLEDDLRGRKVKDQEGKDIGTVVDLLLDDQERKIRFLLVDHGGFLGFGRTRSFLPVDAITEITEHDVHINHSRDHVAEAPPYDPDLVFDRDYHNAVYGHYGYKAYWQPDYTYRSSPTTSNGAAVCHGPKHLRTVSGTSSRRSGYALSWSHLLTHPAEADRQASHQRGLSWGVETLSGLVRFCVTPKSERHWTEDKDVPR